MASRIDRHERLELGLVAQVARREAAADVEIVDRADLAHHLGRERHRPAIGQGIDALRADMEGQAHQLGVAARRPHQRPGILDADPELAGQRQQRTLAGHRQPHEQLEILGAAGGRHDLGQLVGVVEHEPAHAMVVIGLGDGADAFHGVHEVAARTRQQRLDRAHLADRGGVELAHAAGPQGAQHLGRVVALDGIEHVAGERRQHAPGARLDQVRPQPDHRVDGGLVSEQRRSAGEGVSHTDLPTPVRVKRSECRRRARRCA